LDNRKRTNRNMWLFHKNSPLISRDFYSALSTTV